MNATGQGFLIGATVQYPPPNFSAIFASWVYPFELGSSCVRIPSDGGPMGGSAASDGGRGRGARAAGDPAPSRSRQHFGPIEIAGCVHRDDHGRWVHSGDSVRMNGIDIYGKEGTVVFDPRASTVTFTGGSYEIKVGTFTPLSFTLKSPLSLSWGKDGTLDFDPGRYRVLQQAWSGKKSVGPAGLPVVANLGLSLKLAYDQVKKQGTASADFWVSVPLMKGAFSRSVPERATGRPPEGGAAVGARVVRPAPTNPSAGARVPAGAKPTVGGACSPAESGAQAKINARPYSCGFNGQSYAWGSQKVTFPARPGAPCAAALDAGRPPVWRSGATALSCVPVGKANKFGQKPFGWQTVSAPVTAREGQGCSPRQVGMAIPALKPAAGRAIGSVKGKLVCAVAPDGARGGKRTWAFAEDAEAMVTVSLRATTDDGLLPYTVTGTLKNVVLAGVEFASITLRYRPEGKDAQGNVTSPAEFGAAGEVKLGPAFLPDSLRTKVAVDLAWTSTSAPLPTRLWFTITRPTPLAVTPTVPPIPWLWFISGGFGGEKGAPEEPWQVGGTVRVAAGLPLPDSVSYGDQDVYPLELTGDLSMVTETVTADRTVPARTIYSGSMKVFGFPTASGRLEQQFDGDGDVSRVEVEGVVNIDPGALIGLPSFLQAQGKVYGWYDPVNDVEQLQGYVTVAIPGKGRVTANALISSTGMALCYSSGNDLAGWVYRWNTATTRSFEKGCDVGLASPLTPPPDTGPETGDPDR